MTIVSFPAAVYGPQQVPDASARSESGTLRISLRLMAALDIDRATLKRLVEDYKEWLLNANKPVDPVCLAGCCGRRTADVPEYVQSVQGAEYYAALLARYFQMERA